jgi:hypothetical protein
MTRDVWSGVSDYIKYTTAGAAGALVLGIGLLPNTPTYSNWERILLVVSWVLFGLSALAGALAQAAIPVLFGNQVNDLEAWTFTYPARAHQILLVFAAASLGGALVGVALSEKSLDALEVKDAASAVLAAKRMVPHYEKIRKLDRVELIRGVDANSGKDMTWLVQFEVDDVIHPKHVMRRTVDIAIPADSRGSVIEDIP